MARAIVGCAVDADALAFVQLADIHFKTDNSAEQAVQDDVKDQLLRDLRRVCGDLTPLTGILVCGDIAYSGQHAEFTAARDWLKQASDAIGSPQEAVWTVPGNHDVDRAYWSKNRSLRTFHHDLRAAAKTTQRDDVIRQYTVEDLTAAEALMRPLANYNEFAAAFRCQISPDRLHWEKSLPLNDGSTLRIRGMASTLVSSQLDDDGANKLVLGTLQTLPTQQDGVEYMTLCHHPPGWLFDADEIEQVVGTRVRLQIFGHKHVYKPTQIDGALRIGAGATFPSTREPNWTPRYNVLVVSVEQRAGHRTLVCTVVPRVWSRNDMTFVADTSVAGAQFATYPLRIADLASPVVRLPVVHGETETPSKPRPSGAAPTARTPEQSQRPAMDPERRLVYRFLGLSFIARLEIAQMLSLLDESDREVSETERAIRVFQRARDSHRLAELWTAVESKHPDGAATNPFAGNNK